MSAVAAIRSWRLPRAGKIAVASRVHWILEIDVVDAGRRIGAFCEELLDL
jgi:hypothetical protein